MVNWSPATRHSIATLRKRYQKEPAPFDGVDVGARLRLFREAAELTQEALAHRAGRAVKTVSQIENGHTSPSIDVLAHLVERGLQMPLAAFFAIDAPEGLHRDLRKIESLLAKQPPAARARALRVLKALFDD